MKKWIVFSFFLSVGGFCWAGFPGAASPQSRALLESQTEARNIKAYAKSVRDAMEAGPVSANLVTELYLRVVQSSATFNAVKSVPGIAQYAKDQFDNQNLNIVSEYNSMVAAIADVISSIKSGFPVDASGYLLERKFDDNGFNTRSFTSTQTSTMRTKLDALIQSIE